MYNIFSAFNVSNHVISGPTTYRGRPVNEFNVQMILSDVVSKYLPANLPPWQIVVVPVQTPTEPCYTMILYRIHHLLLSDQPNLKNNDLLLIDRMYRMEVDSSATETNPYPPVNYDRSPFNNVIPPAENLFGILAGISTRIANCWNDSRYNLFVNSTNGQGPESVWQLSKCTAITLTTIGYKFVHNAAGVENKFYLDYLWKLFRKEFKRNHLNFSALKLCAWNGIITLNPITLIMHLITIQFAALKWISLELPIFYLNEAKALVFWLRKGCRDQYPPDTVIGYFLLNCPTFFRATKEGLQKLRILVMGPRSIWDLVSGSAHSNQPNALQEVGSCGRKVIAWSEKIPLTDIERLGRDLNTQNNHSEILLTCLAASIKECMENFPIPSNDNCVPESVPVAARCVYQECLLGNLSRANGGVEGIICFNLPLGAADSRDLLQMRRRLKEARAENVTLYSLTRNERRQGYLADMLSPLFVKLMTNYLSRKYCIMITDMATTSDAFGPTPRPGHRTLWGAEILEFDYFRPPVANTKLSITLQRYRDYVRIGVLADAELSPVHQMIINAWPEFIRGWSTSKVDPGLFD